MIESENRTPRLLVSVRNEQEAKAAIDGGCDIVDIKEPQNGSLGRASFDVIQKVAASCALFRVPVSAVVREAGRR